MQTEISRDMPLDALHLYQWDVTQHFPRLPHQQQRERERALIERARDGDRASRNDLILTLQHALFAFAHSLSRRGRAQRPDAELWADLIQEANIAMLAGLDKALRTENPCSYLLRIARNAMLQWVCGRNDPIRRHDKQERIDVLSLDAPLTSGGCTLADVLHAPSQQQETSPTRESRYTLLHEVIHTLKDTQQEVILRHYGFTGPAESLNAISYTIARPGTHKTDVAHRQHQKALHTLRQQLTVKEMKEMVHG